MGLSLRPLFAGPSRLTIILLTFAAALALYAAFMFGPTKGLMVFLIIGGLVECAGWVALMAGDTEEEKG